MEARKLLHVAVYYMMIMVINYKVHVRHATKLAHFIAHFYRATNCPGNCRISVGKQSPNKHSFQHYRHRYGYRQRLESLTLEFPCINLLSLQLKIDIG